MKIHKIEIDFPVEVELPPGFTRALSVIVNLVCERYKEQHPGRTMWPAGHGAKPLWREPEEPDFDDSILHFMVAERKKYPKEQDSTII
jgi:hypothetical protein